MNFVDFRAGARALDSLAQANPGGFSTSLNDLLLDLDLYLPDEVADENYNLLLPVSDVEPRHNFPWPLEKNIQKIAVLISSAIGDFVFALPALEALRHAYPQAEIVCLGLSWHNEFLSNRPSPFDRVEILPPIKGVSEGEDFYQEDPQVQLSFLECMQAEQFDLAIQLHGGGRFSNPFVRQLGARLSIGMQATDADSLDRCIPHHYYQNEVLRYLEVVSLVGATPRTVVPRIQVTNLDLEEAFWLVQSDSRPLVVLHPGAGDPRKRWPVEKFAVVGNAMAWSGAKVVVIGNTSEQDLADRLVRLMSADATNLCGKTSINGLAGLLSRAKVVISNDSGPLHLAAAVGSPTIGIYWLSNAMLAAPTTRSFNRPAIAWRVHCPVCGMDTTRTDCGHIVSWVADVSQEEVIASAIELLRLT